MYEMEQIAVRELIGEAETWIRIRQAPKELKHIFLNKPQQVSCEKEKHGRVCNMR